MQIPEPLLEKWQSLRCANDVPDICKSDPKNVKKGSVYRAFNTGQANQHVFIAMNNFFTKRLKAIEDNEKVAATDFRCAALSELLPESNSALILGIKTAVDLGWTWDAIKADVQSMWTSHPDKTYEAIGKPAFDYLLNQK